jgi:hypothetical protein
MRDDGEGIGFGCGFLAVGMPYSLPSRKAASIRVHSRTSPERGARNFTPINTMSKPHCGHFRTKRGGTTPRWSRTKYSCALLNTFRQLKQACWLRAGIAQRGLTLRASMAVEREARNRHSMTRLVGLFLHKIANTASIFVAGNPEVARIQV